jgi:chromosome segregation ATPase
VQTFSIQRSLTILQDRYRELREIGEKHRLAWEMEEAILRQNLDEVRAEKQGLEMELGEVRGEKDGLERELIDAREESELLVLQLHQVQEELEHYFLQSRDLLKEGHRKDEKLNWLRGQREMLLRMLSLQGRLQQRFITLDARTAFPSILLQVTPWWRRYRVS